MKSGTDIFTDRRKINESNIKTQSKNCKTENTAYNEDRRNPKNTFNSHLWYLRVNYTKYDMTNEW